MHLRNICMRREMPYCRSNLSLVGHARRVTHYELGQCIMKFFSQQTEECTVTFITDYQTSGVKNMEIPKVNIYYNTSDIRVSNLEQKFLTRCETDHKYVLRTFHDTEYCFPSPMVQQPLVGQGLLIIGSSRSHSDTPHSVGILWTSDQPGVEASTLLHTALTRDRHSCPRRDWKPHSQQASGRRLTP
jgi:hypothetical protein